MNRQPALFIITVFAALFGCLLSTAGCGGDSQDAALDAQALLQQFEATQLSHDPRNFTEVDLGEYVTSLRGEHHTVYFIRFHLWAVIPKADEAAFQRLLDRRRERMRDQVLAAVQASELEDLMDPGLSWVKSELKPLVNRSLKTTLVRDVVFSEFSLDAG